MLIHLRATWLDHRQRSTPVDMSAFIREDSVFGKRAINVVFSATRDRIGMEFKHVATMDASAVVTSLNRDGALYTHFGRYTIDKEDRSLLQTMLDCYFLGM